MSMVWSVSPPPALAGATQPKMPGSCRSRKRFQDISGRFNLWPRNAGKGRDKVHTTDVADKLQTTGNMAMAWVILNYTLALGFGAIAILGHVLIVSALLAGQRPDRGEPAVAEAMVCWRRPSASHDCRA
jgi:hypothetical protein